MGVERITVAALFVNDWSHEFDALERGEVPTHRLFGVADLARAGHAVEYLRRPRPRKLVRLVGWRWVQAAWVCGRQRHVDVVLATHEAAAYPALLLRKAGVLRKPVLVMTVAAAGGRDGFAGAVTRAALRAADLLTVFASCQVDPLTAYLGVEAGRVRPLALGVDTGFFRPTGVERGADVAAVGTNPGKDFRTLVDALSAKLVCTIVTDEENRSRAEPHATGKAVTFRSDVPIEQLRDLYAHVGLMVLPLREVGFSSGQTVLLENMAMNTPVVVSDVEGVRDYVEGADVRRVSPGDSVLLARAMEESLGRSVCTRDTVIARFSGESMGAALEKMLLPLRDKGRHGGRRTSG